MTVALFAPSWASVFTASASAADPIVEQYVLDLPGDDEDGGSSDSPSDETSDVDGDGTTTDTGSRRR